MPDSGWEALLAAVRQGQDGSADVDGQFRPQAAEVRQVGAEAKGTGTMSTF